MPEGTQGPRVTGCASVAPDLPEAEGSVISDELRRKLREMGVTDEEICEAIRDVVKAKADAAALRLTAAPYRPIIKGAWS